MKKVTVSGKCNACGLCTIDQKYLEESSTGMAVAVSGKYISDNDLQQVEELVRNCPEGALSIVEEVLNMSKQDFVKNAVKQLESIAELGKPESSDFAFHKSDYSLQTQYPNGQYEFEYSSYEKANRAARNEFDRIAYSQIKVMALNVLTMYRSKCLAPYYDLKSPNLYADNNKKIENILKEINGRYKALFGESLGDKFETFEAYPDTSNCSVLEGLANNRYFSPHFASEVEASINSEYPLSSYETYWDIDDREISECKGKVGTRSFRQVYVTKYGYTNVQNAVKELAKDIINYISYEDIKSSAYDYACSLIREYNYEMENKIRERIDILKRLK